MDEFGELSLREREAKRIARRQWFWLHFAVFATTQIMLFIIWAVGSVEHPWWLYPLAGWSILIAAHAVFAFVIRHPDEILIEREARRREAQQ